MTTKSFCPRTEEKAKKKTTSNPSAKHKSMFYILPIKMYWSKTLKAPSRVQAAELESMSRVSRKCRWKRIELGSSALLYRLHTRQWFHNFRAVFPNFPPAYPEHELKKLLVKLAWKVFHDGFAFSPINKPVNRNSAQSIMLILVRFTLKG